MQSSLVEIIQDEAAYTGVCSDGWRIPGDSIEEILEEAKREGYGISYYDLLCFEFSEQRY